MKRQRKQLNSRGFSLMEVLVVVAMLVIVAAATLPGLVRSYRDLTIAELDDTARELFLSAQGELTELEISGRLAAFGAQGTADGTLTPLAASTELYQMTSADDRLPETARVLQSVGGSYLLELNPVSGDVWAVYYARNADRDLRTAVAELPDLQQETRAEAGIGYYGGALYGSAAMTPPEETEHVDAQFRVVNGDDLYAELTYPALKDRSAVAAMITVTDESGDVWELTADGFGVNRVTYNGEAREITGEKRTKITWVSNGDYTLDVLLDSMTAGNTFAEITGLTPGDDLTVAAQVFYRGERQYENRYENQNSLFSNKLTEDGKLQLTYTRVRHLHNLRNYVVRNMTVLQGSDIDFSARDATLMPGNALADLPAYFEPLTMSSVNWNGLTLDGRGYKLSHFSICYNAASGANTGLIGYSNKSIILQNLLMEDPVVEGTKEVGALAGKLQSSSAGPITVYHCGVYMTEIGRGSVTAGAAATTPGNKPVGGLIGAIQTSETYSVSVSNCFAAISVFNREKVAGGLIGNLGGGMVQNCYASGPVEASSTTAGGLMGLVTSAAASEVNRCFSAAPVNASITAGTLVGQNQGLLQMTDCVSYNQAEAAGEITYGPVIAADSGTTVYSGCRYLFQNNGIANAYTESTLPEGLTWRSYDQLRVLPGAGDAARVSYPWESMGSFPFATVTGDGSYYGDWPVKDEVENTKLQLSDVTYLVYYESYGDGYGYYLTDSEGKTQNSLQDKEILDWGYGLLSQNNSYKLTVGGQKVWTSGGPVSETSANGSTYKLFFISDSENSVLAPGIGQKSQTATLNGDKFKVNIYFAAAIVHNSQDSKGTDREDPIQIRTVEQLENMRSKAALTAGWYFQQTHDITMPEGQTAGGILAVIDTSVNYHYDGDNHNIIGLTKPLFFSNQAEIQNLHLKDVQIRATSAVGALVIYARGDLLNCSVEGSVVSSTQAGGLAYSAAADSTVKNCYFVGSVGSTKGNAAGLIYEPNRATIQNCWAAGTVTASEDSAYGFVGGSQARSQGCYSAMLVSGSWRSYGFAEKAESIEACYWLQDAQHNAGAGGVGIPLTAEQLKTLPAEMDSTTWTILPGSYPYPQLLHNSYTGSWPIQ